MKMRLHLIAPVVLLVLMVIAAVTPCQAQDFYAPPISSEQYNRWNTSKPFVAGIESIENSNLPEAIKAFNKELKLHPGNAYAKCNLVIAQCMMSNRGQARDESIYDKDIPLVKTYAARLREAIAALPVDDKQSRCSAYQALGDLLVAWFPSDSAQALEAYGNAIAVHPCVESYFSRMGYVMDLYEDDDFMPHIKADAMAAYAIAPTDFGVVKVMAMIANHDGDSDSFMKYYAEYQAIVKSQEESPNYDIEMMAARHLADSGNTEAAIDKYLMTIVKFENVKSLSELLNFIKNDDDAIMLTLMKTRQMQFAAEDDGVVLLVIEGLLLRDYVKDYHTALSYFKEREAENPGANLYVRSLAKCYYMTGDMDNARLYYQALSIIDGSNDYRNFQYQNGEVASLLDYYKTCNSTADFYNYDATYYNSQASLHMLNRDWQQALDILDTGMGRGCESLETDCYYGLALNRLNRGDEARPWLEKAFAAGDIENDDFNPMVQVRALIELGNTSQALVELEKMRQHWARLNAEQAPGIPGNSNIDTYDLAGLYALAGDSARALELLKYHFENDEMRYNFGLIALDWHLDGLRSLPEFQQLVAKYQNEWRSNAKAK